MPALHRRLRTIVPVTALVVALTAGAAGCTTAGGAAEGSSTAATAPAGAAAPDYLWALSAADASVIGDDDSALYLQLTDVDELVTRFTDRPDRLASAVDLQDFLSRWDGRFDDAPPNAVLSYTPASQNAQRQIVVTLSRPRWDESTRSLVFAAERIRKEADDLADTEHPIDVPVIGNPRTTGPVAVFIDGAGSVSDVGPVIGYSSANARELLDVSAQLSTDGFSESTTELAQRVQQLTLLVSELIAAESDLRQALDTGAEPAAATRSVLAGQGITLSNPLDQGDLDAVTDAVDAVEDTQQLVSQQLQDAVSRETDSQEMQDRVRDALERARNNTIDTEG